MNMFGMTDQERKDYFGVVAERLRVIADQLEKHWNQKQIVVEFGAHLELVGDMDFEDLSINIRRLPACVRLVRVGSPSMPLTGKELRYAIQHRVPVRCVVMYDDPRETKEEVWMGLLEKAPCSGYLLGNLVDIDPDSYEDEEPVVVGDTDLCFSVLPVDGKSYA